MVGLPRSPFESNALRGWIKAAMISRDRNSSGSRLGAIQFVLWLLLVFVLPIDAAHAQAVPATCPASLGTADLIDHDLNPSVSFCELCGVGTVRIEIVNPFTPGGGSEHHRGGARQPRARSGSAS